MPLRFVTDQQTLTQQETSCGRRIGKDECADGNGSAAAVLFWCEIAGRDGRTANLHHRVPIRRARRFCHIESELRRGRSGWQRIRPSRGAAQLPLLDHRHELDVRDDLARRVERFESILGLTQRLTTWCPASTRLFSYFDDCGLMSKAPSSRKARTAGGRCCGMNMA